MNLLRRLAKRLFHPAGSPARAPRPRTALRLEQLEDRLVPAIFIVNSLGDAADTNLKDGVADSNL
jgi:hypothetical protein